MTIFITNIFRVTVTLSWLLFGLIDAVHADTQRVTTAIIPSSQTVTGAVNKAITSTKPYSTVGFSGAVTYSVLPALPSGLAILSNTGVISGTPTVALSKASYTVSAAGATSGKAQAKVNITIAGTSPVSTPVASSLNCPTAPFLTVAEEGRRAYMRLNCYSCHGDKGAGGMGPNISGAESGDVQEAVTSGAEGGMPAFKNYLCPNDISNLSAYLQVISSKTAPAFKQWWLPNPTQ